MKVTHIESHEISLEYVDWLAYPLNHYYGPGPPDDLRGTCGQWIDRAGRKWLP